MHAREPDLLAVLRIAIVGFAEAVMRVSPDWDSFMRNFNRNFRPHIPVQRDLFEEIEAQEKKEAAN